MNDFLIEERISTLLSLIDSLQLDILKLEAKTVSKVIEKKIKQKDKIIVVVSHNSQERQYFDVIYEV